MVGYTLYAASGIIVQDGTAAEWADVFQMAADRGLLAIPGRYSGRDQYVSKADPVTLRPRRRVTLPEEREIAVGEVWTIDAPAGTEVWIDGVFAGTDDVLSFAVPGTYHLAFVPPAPSIGADATVTVA